MKTFVALALAMTWMVPAISAAALPDRPPQFVLISFDGSKNHSFWQESLDLADATNSKFSYFISGVYFLQGNLRAQYQPPGNRKAGASDIGFAKPEPYDITKRVGYVWRALQSDFDIGSHVNGHFDGGAWDLKSWISEFTQFHNMVEKVFENNSGVKAPFSAQWEQQVNQNMVGFRAPLLAENLATNETLKKFNYLYDASSQTDRKWPSQKKNGVWNIGLTRIDLLGTKRKTVAMDYNVFYGQCNGKFGAGGQECQGLTPHLMEYFENQIYLSYINVFLNNYKNNRAPISIGHHFSLWNRGVYWRGLQRAIKAMCSQPEVQCITHKEMVVWMQAMIKKYGSGVTGLLNQGDFPKNDIPTSVAKSLPIDMNLLKVAAGMEVPDIDDAAGRLMLKGDLPGAHAETDDDIDFSQFGVNP